MAHRHRRPTSSACRAVLGGVAAVVAVALATGCSGSSSPSSSTPSPEDAAGVVVQAFRLPESTRSCLVDGFSQRSAARAALTTTDEPSGAEQDALGEVVDDCVTPDEFATAWAASIGVSLPPTDPARVIEQANCLHDAVLALEDGPRRTLVVGLLTIGGPIVSDLAMARNDLINGLFATCEVTVAQ
ncbi:MAG TPA: hypothetical protein VIY72_16950 [Acidimicrobiales bacterium]